MPRFHFASVKALRKHLAEHNPDALALSQQALDKAEMEQRTKLNEEYAKLDRKAKQEALANQFLLLWNEVTNGEELIPEYKFHPKRKWRADFYHEASKGLIEIEGGTYSGGRHVRPGGYGDDVLKYNEATRLGYTLQRITTDQMNVERVAKIAEALNIAICGHYGIMKE